MNNHTNDRSPSIAEHNSVARFGQARLCRTADLASMTYQPAIRPLKGMQNMARPAMSAICDVCHKPRVRKGGHDKCSKIRQAAGFIIKRGAKA